MNAEGTVRLTWGTMLFIIIVLFFPSSYLRAIYYMLVQNVPGYIMLINGQLVSSPSLPLYHVSYIYYIYEQIIRLLYLFKSIQIVLMSLD